MTGRVTLARGLLAPAQAQAAGEDGRRREPRASDPGGDGYAGHSRSLTATTEHRRAAKPTAKRTLQLRRGEPSAAPALPAWWDAARIDLGKLTQDLRGFLGRQRDSWGAAPEIAGRGDVRELLFMDADLTLFKSTTPVFIKNQKTGYFLRHPESGRMLMVGVGPERDNGKELRQLKERFPFLPWQDAVLDYREFGSIIELWRTGFIPEAVSQMAQVQHDPKARCFIVTARSTDAVADGMRDVLLGRKIDIDGVLAVNSPRFLGEVGLGALPITEPQRKAVAMAAALELYGAKSLRFVDDTDKNLRSAMELLPALFPSVTQKYFDVVHQGGETYRQHLVGRTAPTGELIDARGRPLQLSELERHLGKGRPFPVDRVYHR